MRERALRGTDRTLVLVVLLGALAVWLLPACGHDFLRFDGSASRPDVAPQSWWHERGPVVPHDDFPSDCSLCHRAGSWNDIRDDFVFDHLAETGVELRGAHARAECLRCHNDRGPVDIFADRGCMGCHEDPHRRQLGVQCNDCHGENDWRPDDVIAQHLRTRFPLVGAHAAVACFACHPGSQSGDFARATVECVGCHAGELSASQDPDHLAAGWVTDCDDCHSATTWGAAGFTHTAWPLTGGHAVADCSACHVGGTFIGTPTDCDACHLADFNATVDPDHVASGFPTVCDECHGTASWDGAAFDHSLWPLTGSHLAIDCETCHVGGVFIGTPNDCAACHQDDYDATSDPDHGAAGFSTTCDDCHGTTMWGGAGFDHSSWPLTGQHNGVDCLSCHEGGVFIGTPTDCVSCHQEDYDATNDPDHMAAGFPLNCETCHDTGGWDGADFNHAFPIEGGDHGNLDCSECHVVPMSFRTFSCIDCHEHDQREMDDEHDDVGGYVYASNACYGCHPDGDD